MLKKIFRNLAAITSMALLPMVITAQKAETTDLPLAAQQKESSYFGINGSKVFHIPTEAQTTVQFRLNWMEELGVYWDRIDFWWHETEKERGNWDFARSDLSLDTLEKRGVQLYPILAYGAAWYEEGKNAPDCEEDVKDFAEYVRQIVGRNKDRVTYWALWNEPNIPTFWKPSPNPEIYALLVKEAAKAAREANPDVKLGAPVIAPLGQWDREFVEKIYQLGIKDSFDVFDYHYYRNHPPEIEVPQEIAEIRAVMHRYGDGDKPMWISESGVTGFIQSGPEGLDKQAYLIVRNQLLCLSLGIERFFYFDLQNWYDTDDLWDCQLGLVTADCKKKPSFDAYKTMVQEVDHRPIIGRCLDIDDKVQGVLVYDDKEDFYKLALWLADEEKSKDVTIKTTGKEALLVDLYGEKSVINSVEKDDEFNASFKLDRHPVYLHHVDPSEYLPQAGVKVDPPMTILSLGDETTQKIKISPLLKNPQLKVVSVETPEGIEWDPSTGTIKMTKPLTAGKVDISTTVDLQFELNEKSVSKQLVCSGQIEIVPSMNSSLRPMEVDGQLVAKVSLSNQTQRDMSGTLHLYETKKNQKLELVKEELGSLPATSRKDVTLDVLKDILLTYNQVTTWEMEFAGISAGDPFRWFPVGFGGTPPVIDGDLSEWGIMPSVKLNDPKKITRNPESWTIADTSAECSLRMDKENLYYAAMVRDDDPMVNTEPALTMWKADALALYIGFRGPTDRPVINKEFEFQLGFAPTCETGEPVAFWFHEDKVIESATVVAVKTKSGYMLEAQIPLAALGMQDIPLENGYLIGLDFGLDDLDGDDWAPEGNLKGRSIVWNGTSQNWINPSGWGGGILKQLK